MPTQSSSVSKWADTSLFRQFPRYASVAVGLFGLLDIVAWYAHWQSVLQMLPNTAPMQYNTALCFVLLGTGLFLLTTSRRKIAPWLGGVVIMLALSTLLEYGTGWDFRIDQFFLKPYFQTAATYPGRMSPLAAVCLSLLGVQIILVSLKKSQRLWFTIAGMLTCIVGVIALVALFGFSLGIEAATGWGAYSRLALNTSVALLLLSMGMMTWCWDTARRDNFNFLRWLPVTGAVTLMAMVAFVSAVNMVELKKATFWREHTIEVILDNQKFQNNLIDLQRGARSYVTTGDTNALADYWVAARLEPQLFARLDELTKDNPEQQRRLKDLALAMNAFFNYHESVIQTYGREGFQAAFYMDPTTRNNRIYFGNVYHILKTFSEEEQRLLNVRGGVEQADAHNAATLLIFGSVLAAILLLTSGYLATREMNRRRRMELKLGEITRLQKAILNSANYAIISTTAQGVVTTFNSTAENWLGYTAAEAVGGLTPARWHDADEVMAHAKNLSLELGRTIEPDFETFVAKARLGQVDENEWTLIRKDGSRFPISLSATAIVDDNQKITGFLGVIADITERRRATEALLESKRFLRSTLDALSSHIAILDEHGTIIEVNAAWNHFAAYNTFLGSEHGLGDNYLRVCESASGKFSEEAPVVASSIRAVMAGQRDEFHLEYPCDSPKEKRWFIVRASRFDDAGRVRVVVAHEDITERKQLETEREKLISELQAALAEVKTLSGMIPICAWCKNVRNDAGYWSTVEQYVRTHTGATFSHGMCPDCTKKFEADLLKENHKKSAYA